MTALTPLALLTTAVGALMILAGLGRDLLQARSGGRRCASSSRNMC
jgi:hypothetical protein